ncbi:F0F1 ATP synthase subunit epsilon [Antarctobacter sp.]|uniref:F0F1 ATP synthase subunit epsilon n=1 Tax=Antarctobacter sp. TaxID=1872577 RepID=UPI002B2697D1|nr:F0F1 ATP synthase subunit epsilon [Antarctobacter sp.]
MSKTLTLTVTTPLDVEVAETGVTSVRAEDRSGSFGLLPGHADFLTVLGASVLRWRGSEGVWHYCALRGGILRVSAGDTIDVACREAVRGDDLSVLEALVKKNVANQVDAARRARAEHTRLHTNAIRSLMRQLGPTSGQDDLAEDFR